LATSLGFNYTASTVYLADGANFPDALSAGAVAGAQGRVILLTGSPSTLGAGAAAYLSTATLTHVTSITAVGLTGAVSVATFNAAVAAL
jgi:ell wall binding domain 2 (CWB2)